MDKHWYILYRELIFFEAELKGPEINAMVPVFTLSRFTLDMLDSLHFFNYISILLCQWTELSRECGLN